MKTIVAVTDFSKAASNAVDYAREMARELGARLLLLHVYEIPIIYGNVAAPMDIDQNLEAAKEELESLKTRLAGTGPSEMAVSCRVRLGTFFTELSEVCKEVSPMIVVMGSQGTTAAERLLFGAHAVYALKHLEWPVIAVPKNARYVPIRRIGVALDLKHKTDPDTYLKINDLVRIFSAELHILNSGDRKEFSPEIIHESHRLENSLGTIEPHYDFISKDDPDEGVLALVKKYHIDLLIVLPKHHDLLHKLISRSHTKDLVAQAKVPIMGLHV